ncbi:MAG: DUF853 family protein [Eubacterium sp.]|nr:DUF853 family protein [Candidatus Colimonas fimequi]
MVKDEKIYFARTGQKIDDNYVMKDDVYMLPKLANRHGFICGATGTGKSVTLKILAESFSEMGVPVFLSDVKGDMAGIAVPGEDSEGMQKRIARFEIGDTFKYEGCPVSIFDIYGQKGIPMKTTVSEMGPQLLSQVLDLNDVQTDLLTVVFKIADDNELHLYDTKDVKAMLQFVADNADQFELDYGHIAPASISTIIRSIVAIESEGGDVFFGEPTIDINDFFRTVDGRGVVNILDSESLINRPRLYSAFMLYLLSELFEVLPEVGDPEKPKIVFFFDEAHLLFKNASKALLEKIEQVIKLIRSKGVGIFFITQSPGDIPDSVMSQLGNKIEHGLRAYTPAELKVVKAAASAFRENPEFDTMDSMLNLGTGEAIVSMLDEKGTPGIAQYAYVLPPKSSMSAISEEERQSLITSCELNSKYNVEMDSESAYEIIMAARQQAQAEAEAAAAAEAAEAEKAAKEAEKAKKAKEKADKVNNLSKMMNKSTKKALKSTGGAVGREVGKAVGEAVLGKKGKTIGGNLGANLGRNILGTILKS